MGKWRRSWLLLAGAALVLAPLTGRADDRYEPVPHRRASSVAEPPRSESHVPLPPGPGGVGDTERLFTERFGQSEGLSKLRQDAQKYFGKDLDQLIRDIQKSKLKIDPRDKDFKEQLEKVMRDAKMSGKDVKDLKLTDQEIEAARKLLEDIMPKKSEPKLDSTRTPKINPKLDPKTDPADAKAKPPTPDGRVEPPESEGMAPDPGQEAWRARFTRWLLQQGKGLEGLGKTLDESPALRELVRDLSRAMVGSEAGKGGDAWEKYLKGAAEKDTWLAKFATAVGSVELPSLPSFSPPTVAVRPAPSITTPAVNPSGTAGLGPTVAWLAVLGVLAVLLWKLLNGRFSWRGARPADEWRLGPWPVRPEAVSSREELVRGFEYLTLLLLGRQARSWNHRHVAEALGGDAPERRQAASELAAVYEKTRYAPSDEPLDGDALAAARRDLCYLAGVDAV